MNLLLDTHVALWWAGDSGQLNEVARHAITSADIVYVSAASMWEIAIKVSRGKLRLGSSFAKDIARSHFTPLAITFVHAQGVVDLPFHHGDPFDRLLIAQAKAEGLTLVTHDRQFEAYGVPLVWT